MESFHSLRLEDCGIDFKICQVNLAKSTKGVLRGLHFQTGSHAQSKLVSVINGSVLDVVVDLRPFSSTFKQHFKYILDAPEKMLYVPKGFAHGYYALQSETLFYYLVDNFYSAENEGGVRFDDEVLDIEWGDLTEAIISEKDLNQPYLHELIFDR